MKKTHRRILCLLLCLALCTAFVSACGGGGSDNAGSSSQPGDTATGSNSSPGSQSPAPSQTSTAPSVAPALPSAEEPPPPDSEYYDHLTVLINDKISVVDLYNPAVGSSQLAFITQNLYNRLIRRTPEAEFEPELALSWSTEDYVTFNFKLRDDVYFHNGEKFTAADVAYTIEQSHNAPGTAMYDRYSQVDSVEIVNDYEVNVILETVDVDFYHLISASTGGILNEKAYNDDPEKGSWVGTGPWILTELVQGESMQFIRNDNYFGEAPLTSTMTFRYIAEPTAKLIMIENDEADITNLDSAYIPPYENDPDYLLWGYTMDNTNMIAFNMNDPILSDINFRLAVAHAFRPEDCLEITLNGYGVVMDSGTFWGGATEFRNNDIPKYEFDLDLAKEYLEKSSYNGEPIEAVASMSHTIKNAQILQENLRVIGINIEIFETDGPTMSAYLQWSNNDHQIVVGSSVWGGRASTARNYLYPGMTSNNARYDNPRVNELIDLGGVTMDRSEREKIYREIQEIVAEDVPYIPIFNMSLYYISQQGFGGVVWYPDNNHDFSHAYRVKM